MIYPINSLRISYGVFLIPSHLLIISYAPLGLFFLFPFSIDYSLYYPTNLGGEAVIYEKLLS